MIRIDLKPLKPGIHNFEWDVGAEELGLDPKTFDRLHIDVRLDYHPSNIFVTLHTQALARLVCDRTLKDFHQAVEGDYQILFSAERPVEGEEFEEGIRFLDPKDEEIDLTDGVRDTFMLSLPQRRVAPGAESEEIPLQFGAPDKEGYIDSRWEALRGLKADDG